MAIVFGQIAIDGEQRGERQVSRERQNQQRREEAHRQQADPREAVAERLLFDGARQHAERYQKD
jgi:hypothetical protein